MKPYWGVCSCCGKIKPIGEHASYRDAFDAYKKFCDAGGLKTIWVFEGLPVILGKDGEPFAVVNEPIVMQLSNNNFNLTGPPEVEVRIVDCDAIDRATYRYRNHPTLKDYVAENN